MSKGEATPLLRARERDADATSSSASGNEDEPLGSARFPFHPKDKATPRWRKLFLFLFDDQTHITDPLDGKDLWRLERQFRGTHAAAELRKRIPSTGRARLLRGVWAVNRRRVLRLVLLNAVATPFAALRPLLLFYLFHIGLSQIDVASAERHGRYDSWEVCAPIAAIVVTEFLLGLVRSHAASVAVRVYLQLSSSLSTLITERVMESGTPVEGLASSPSKNAPIGRKQRLTETTNMLTNNLNRVASVPLVTHSMWTMAVRLAVSVVVLLNVVAVSWVVVIAAAAAYVVLLLAEVVFGVSLSTRFETAFARRLNAIHESVMSIQMVKMNAWEDKMEHKILEARSMETSAANRITILSFVMKEIAKESPVLVTALVFAMDFSSPPTIESRVGLSPAQLFTTLLLVQDCFRCAEKLKSACQHLVVARRVWGSLESFLLVRADHHTVSTKARRKSSPAATTTDVIVELRAVCMSAATHGTQTPPHLINVDWEVRKGELVVIHGPAGVGKSLLLSSLLGEDSSAKVQSGSLCGPPLGCRIAYCSQDPWLQTLSIRDNILFGAAFNKEKYWAVVSACGLLEDLAVLPAGDATAVGPRGINLSSGQSARIALARACYADADLYLLDCPLANVDAVVQSQIFRKCIVELLMFKTVVIVTHNPEYVGSSFVDQLVEVRDHGVRVSSRVRMRGARTGATPHTTQVTRRMRDYQSTITSRKAGDRSLWITPLPSELKMLVEEISLSRKPSVLSLENQTETLDTFISRSAIQQFICCDGRRGWSRVISTAILAALWGSTCIYRDIWMLNWRWMLPTILSNGEESELAPVIYGALALTCVALGLLTQASALSFNVVSTGRLFSRMVRAVLRARMTFFYSTPLGDTLNPFFTDLGEVDMVLPFHLGTLILSFFTLLGRAMVIGWLLGPLGIAVTVAGNAVLLRCLSIKFYVGLTHLVRVSNAKQLSVMVEVLDGEPVLRAFGDGHIAHKLEELEAAFEVKNRIEYFTDTFNSFAVLREEAVLAVMSLMLLGILVMQSVNLSEFVLIVLYILITQQEYVSQFGSGMVNTCDQLYSIHRLRAIGDAEMETESPDDVQINAIDLKWPEKGEVVFEHVHFVYSSNKEGGRKPNPALNNVSFNLHGGEKIGVIGRTGSGKSSLAMALLRIHPLRSGRIVLDGVDLRTVPLTQLRRSFTIIPQSPTFYRCSIRDYLDPFHEFDDARLWRELLTLDLGTRVQSLEDELLDNGENWSLGQRQLLCFARALLRPSRVVVLDEAFSCVDQSCQEKVLSILRDRFASSTVILITHRLDQILEFDRILVMQEGRLVESGSASELASQPDSVFYEFLETSLLTL